MNAERLITGKTVLIGMLSFFAVIFAVNGAFVYFALDSWPGLSVEASYEKGLKYNRTLASAERQSKLGWRSQVNLVREKDNDFTFRAVMETRAGAKLRNLKLHVVFERPTNKGHDQLVKLTEITPGIYGSRIQLPLSGRWSAKIKAEDTSGNAYVMRHDVTAK